MNNNTSEHKETKAKLTKKRLWFLYCLAGLIKSKMSTITGWTRHEIDYRLRRWDLTMYSPAHTATSAFLRINIASGLGILDNSRNLDLLLNIQHAFQRKLRDRFCYSTVAWKAIDSLPEPEVFFSIEERRQTRVTPYQSEMEFLKELRTLLGGFKKRDLKDLQKKMGLDSWL